MTMYTLKTTETEANQILAGVKMFVFRSNQTAYRVGDRISFRVVKQSRMVKHKIEDNVYEICYVSENAPVEKGFVVIGFRRTK